MFSFKSPWWRNLNRGICHTPIFDQKCHWHVSLDPAVIRRLTPIRLWLSVKISAERYFKIPHYSSESDPLLSVFCFFIIFLISIFYFLINSNFVYKNLYLIKILFLYYYLVFLVIQVQIFLCPNPSLRYVTFQSELASSATQTQEQKHFFSSNSNADFSAPLNKP